MEVLIFENEYKETILRLKAEEPLEAFNLGHVWAKSRESVDIRRTHLKPEIEIILKQGDRPKRGVRPGGDEDDRA